ncbi:MAG: ribosome maturation factor RimM [Myxococcota bacterium]|nr:ribosome maturation factor RimM [Myxococcota bacterium]
MFAASSVAWRVTNPWTDPLANPLRVELGRIVGAHALGGEVRVRWFGDGPDHLLGSEFVFLGEGREDSEARRYGVRGGGSGRRGEIRLRLEGVDDRTAAEGLRGSMVLVDAEKLEPLGDDEFYWHELMGWSVWTEQGESVGIVRELWNTGGHDVLVVVGERGQVLVPTARAIMKEVNRAEGRIVIDAIPGLLGEEED